MSWESLSILSRRNCPTPSWFLLWNRCFEPQSQATLDAPTGKFETPLKYNGLLCTNDVCTIIWLLQLVKQVQSSSVAPAHPFQSSGHTWIHLLAGAITWFSFLWVGSCFSKPSGLEIVQKHVDSRWSVHSAPCSHKLCRAPFIGHHFTF